MMTANAASALTLENVDAGYGPTMILEGISLTLPRAGTLAVLGRNGVGKTTLLATIMGHTTLHAGRLRLLGDDITGLAAYRRPRRGLGWVPQEREVFRSLSVHENLLVAERPGRWTAERVYEFFPSLAERRTHGGGELSGGEQQMLAIGRALMGNPLVLLLDEPLEGLAPVVADRVLAGLDRLKREEDFALILVEQHARTALEFSDNALVLDRGRVVFAGAAAELLASPERLAALMGIEIRPKQMRRPAGSLPIAGDAHDD